MAWRYDMKCPHCQTENPGGARFCFHCGAALAPRCTNCETELPAGAHFCMNCGQPVGASTPADDARLTRLAAATPVPLAQKVLDAAHLAGERRTVTALFMDVVGSTALANQMDPEDWTAIMNGAFDRFYPAIYRYEGSIARLLGDALLAFFGAPVAHEDDPVRAVRAALYMLEIAREYGAEVRERYGVEFAVRIGLNTGPVIVGRVGSDLRYEYAPMGGSVNLAARMQASARPMSVLISDHVHRFVAPLFDVKETGPCRGTKCSVPRPTPARCAACRGCRAPWWAARQNWQRCSNSARRCKQDWAEPRWSWASQAWAKRGS